MNFNNIFVVGLAILWFLGQFGSLIKLKVGGKKTGKIDYLNVGLVALFATYFYYQNSLYSFLSGIALSYFVAAFSTLIFGGILRSYLMKYMGDSGVVSAYGAYFAAREATLMIVVAVYFQSPCLVGIALATTLGCLDYFRDFSR